jgi:hypothetical protein
MQKRGRDRIPGFVRRLSLVVRVRSIVLQPKYRVAVPDAGLYSDVQRRMYDF